jgi:UDP-N-acetylmuramoylalanine--D-glutamate ligase
VELKGKKVLVVGLGKTGMALVTFLLNQGAQVSVSDTRDLPVLQKALSSFMDQGYSLELEGGGHTIPFFQKAEMVLVSPGIALDLPALKAVEARGVSVWGELEIFSMYSQTPVVAVTGTNGKTTTTALLNEMLVDSGKNTYLGGNIGRPLMDYILQGEKQEIVVAEISSFQLDTTRRFSPQVGILLNITEDHLDRYVDFQAYVDSKASLFRNQGMNAPAVINGDDPLCRSIGERLTGPVYFFSRLNPVDRGGYLDGQKAVLCLSTGTEDFSLEGFSLPGVHNLENALAAIVGARLSGATPEGIQRALQTFKGFGHRLQYVAELRGVRFYDDSKATNVGAVVKALEGFQQPVILIAGGRDKGGDYGPLQDLIKAKVRHLILMGEAREIMRKQLGPYADTLTVDTLDQAVLTAFEKGQPGDAVLLSPACSSFDMFRDYAQRGDLFQEAVRNLADQYASGARK